jgi:D-tyrosyl-tRNA(Tyr) deacylase
VRVLLQRVSRAEVRIDGAVRGRIGRGVLVLLGVEDTDPAEDAAWYADKTADLRIFPDEEGKMNRSLLDVSGEALVVSQFTLVAATRRGRRPSFSGAAPPERAEALYRRFTERLRERGVPVATGSFGAMMDVELVNDGPVTILLEPRTAAGEER